MRFERYNAAEAEARWRKIWDERGIFATPNKERRRKYYVLEMFPYPSGRVHIGHVRNYTMGDVVARVKRAKGFSVPHAMGWDAFGMPAENAAMERKVHPKEWTYADIAAMKAQLKSMGLSLDWRREVATCGPAYYKHQQKMFLDFLRAGLVERNTLPEDVRFDRPDNPLDHHPTWKHVVCPQCGNTNARRETDGDARRAVLIATGEEVEIGPIEKMSKSKRNTVDPDDIIGEYGADVARWFMLSDSPPERDVQWTERGVQGAARFVQRLWRLVNEAGEIGRSAPATRPAQFSSAAAALRKAAHKALAAVGDDVEKLHFNVCVAHIYEFANALTAAIGDIEAQEIAPDLRWAMREAADILVQLFAPMMPHLAEESWAALGHDTFLVAQAPWPAVERELLVEDTITLPVQINGKKRAEVTVPRDAGDAEIEAAVLALDAVQKALDGKTPKKVIIVPKRIVNVVA
jgi:leucyl-tRNA synthetase